MKEFICKGLWKEANRNNGLREGWCSDSRWSFIQVPLEQAWDWLFWTWACIISGEGTVSFLPGVLLPVCVTDITNTGASKQALAWTSVIGYTHTNICLTHQTRAWCSRLLTCTSLVHMQFDPEGLKLNHTHYDMVCSIVVSLLLILSFVFMHAHMFESVYACVCGVCVCVCVCAHVRVCVYIYVCVCVSHNLSLQHRW